MSSDEEEQNNVRESSLYEPHRTPQKLVTGATKIAVSPESLRPDLMCPICLDTLNKTIVTKECFHRFCSECIITALRLGNKECPTCRKKLVSKRSLWPDHYLDSIISKIYPNRDEDEAHQEKVLAKPNKTHSQTALVNSNTEGIKLQSQNRQLRSQKIQDNNSSTHGGEAAGTQKEGSVLSNAQLSSNLASVRSKPSSGPSNVSSTSKNASTSKRGKSLMTSKRSEPSEADARTEADSMDTEGESDNLETDEIELIIKPHPTEMTGDNQLIKALKENSVRYIKTTANATVDHLSKYLAMRLILDTEPPETYPYNFCIYISSASGQMVVLSGAETLRQILDKYWKFDKPLEIFYSCKKT